MTQQRSGKPESGIDWRGWLRRSAASEGTTSTEYAVLLGTIGVAVLAGAFLMGGHSRSAFQGTSGSFPAHGSSASTGTPTGGTGHTYSDSFDGHGNLKWTNYNGSWHSTGGQLVSNDLGAMSIATVPGPNYTASMTMQTTAVGGPDIWDVTRMVFRFQDPNNYYALVPKTDGNLELAKMQGGQWRPWLAYAHTGADPTKAHKYEVTVSGSRLLASVDGVAYIDYTDPNALKGTGVGATNSLSKGDISSVVIQTH